MSLSPLAPAFLPHSQCSSDPPLSLCNSTTMGLPLARLFCGMPPQIISSHAPPMNQLITEGTFILPLIQSTNPSKQDAEVQQPPWILIYFVLTPPTAGELSTGNSQEYPTIQPTLEGRKPRSTDITTHCPSTAK